MYQKEIEIFMKKQTTIYTIYVYMTQHPVYKESKVNQSKCEFFAFVSLKLLYNT